MTALQHIPAAEYHACTKCGARLNVIQHFPVQKYGLPRWNNFNPDGSARTITLFVCPNRNWWDRVLESMALLDGNQKHTNDWVPENWDMTRCIR